MHWLLSWEQGVCDYISHDLLSWGCLYVPHVIFASGGIKSNMAPKEAVESIPNLLISSTDNGFQTGRTCLKFYQMFDNYLTDNEISRPVVVMSDGHSSWFDSEVLHFCQEKQICQFLLQFYVTLKLLACNCFQRNDFNFLHILKKPDFCEASAILWLKSVRTPQTTWNSLFTKYVTLTEVKITEKSNYEEKCTTWLLWGILPDFCEASIFLHDLSYYISGISSKLSSSNSIFNKLIAYTPSYQAIFRLLGSKLGHLNHLLRNFQKVDVIADMPIDTLQLE